MRENYNSFDYWENVINQNKTIRGHAFMQKPPTEKSLYFHTLIFSKKNGINNMWGYFPNIKGLIGYIQYSFLQEAFYKWIYGQENLITRIPPHFTVDRIALEGQKNNKITKDIAARMRRDYEQLNKMWDLPSHKAEMELKNFIRDFNKRWIGDNNQFIYIRFFKTPEELCEFVISSSLMTSTEKELESKIGMTLDEWRNVCKLVTKDNAMGDKFRKILLKKLTEVF